MQLNARSGNRSNKAPNRRRGAVAVEAAIVYPVMLLLLLGFIVLGLGVFRYQLVACQAREASRWASCRGSSWASDTSQTCPTKSDILKNAVLPLAQGMDTTQLSIQVEWINQVTGAATDWDAASKDPTSQTTQGDVVNNSIRVTVTYKWTPGVVLGGTIALQSVSELPMSN